MRAWTLVALTELRYNEAGMAYEGIGDTRELGAWVARGVPLARSLPRWADP